MIGKNPVKIRLVYNNTVIGTDCNTYPAGLAYLGIANCH